MLFTGSEPKKMKKCAASRPLHHIKLDHILRPFQIEGQLLEKHSWTGKKRGAQLDSLGSKLFYMKEEAAPQASTIWGDLPNLEEDFGQSWGVILSHVQSPSSWLNTILGGNQLCLGGMTGWSISVLCNVFAFLWNSTLGWKPLFVRGHVGFWHGSYSWDLYWQQHVGAAFVHLLDWVGLGLCWSVDGK